MALLYSFFGETEGKGGKGETSDVYFLYLLNLDKKTSSICLFIMQFHIYILYFIKLHFHFQDTKIKIFRKFAIQFIQQKKIAHLHLHQHVCSYFCDCYQFNWKNQIFASHKKNQEKQNQNTNRKETMNLFCSVFWHGDNW